MTAEEQGPSADAEHYPGRDLEAMQFAHNYHRWILEEARPFIGRVVAEVGAGRGSFSRLLLQLSHIEQLIAFEPSMEMFQLLMKAIGSDPRVSPQQSRFATGRHTERFDSIVYVNVLEHVENDREELQRIRESLRLGGTAIIFVPALRFLFSKLDRDLGHFRRYSLRELAEKINTVGLQIERCRYFDALGVVPWFTKFVVLKRELDPRSVFIYDRFVVPLAKRLERILRPPLGKNIFLVAKRTV